jgi:hypothetical protein
MKFPKFAFLFILFFGLGMGYYLHAKVPAEKKLRHVVAFKFKSGTTPAQMQKATTDFLHLKKLVPQIIELEGGPDIAFEKKNNQYTHCFVVTVKNPADLAIYGAHPDHKAFSRSVDSLLAEVMVVDYWTE